MSLTTLKTVEVLVRGRGAGRIRIMGHRCWDRRVVGKA